MYKHLRSIAHFYSILEFGVSDRIARPEVLESGSNASFFLVWEMIRWLIVIASRVVCKNRWS